VPVGLFIYESPHSHFLAVSRTCTAPLDRLKIFLITRPPELGGPSPSAASAQITGAKTIINAVARIYSEGGVLAFWTGNGLSVAKIFPESAIKFFAYESSVRSTYLSLKCIVTYLIIETCLCKILGQGG
jgi:hypothetical protein